MNHGENRERRHNGAQDQQTEDRHRQAPPRHSIPTKPPVRSGAVWGPIAGVGLLALLVMVGVWRHIHERRQQEEFAKQTTQLAVNVVTAQRDRKPKELVLPGTFQAFQETTIYPRANGYVKTWNVDIGDNVRAGQLLAEIETPEVDQQLAQAKANYDIAKVTADRWRDLAAKKVVAAQENDEKQKAAEAARANLPADLENLVARATGAVRKVHEAVAKKLQPPGAQKAKPQGTTKKHSSRKSGSLLPNLFE